MRRNNGAIMARLRKSSGIDLVKIPNKVIVVGPPNSGKSVLIEHIKNILEERGIDYGYVDLDLWGSTYRLFRKEETPKERKIRKDELEVTSTMIEEKVVEFETISNDIVLADTPGEISDELDTLIEPGTMAIIVCRKECTEELDEWEKYLDRNHIEIIGIIHSVINSEEIISRDEIIETVISDLNRKNLVDPSPGTVLFVDELTKRLGI